MLLLIKCEYMELVLHLISGFGLLIGQNVQCQRLLLP